MAAAKPNDVISQIQSAWNEAQAQLAVLREQVERATALAQAKVQQNALTKEIDLAYRDLGAAVWTEVSQGRLKLPPQFDAVRKALHGLQQKVAQQNAALNDLLDEGVHLTKQRTEKSPVALKPVAPQNKKR